MSSICGTVNFDSRYVNFERLMNMGKAMILRGREQSGAYVKDGVGLQHNRMIVSGDKSARQPYTKIIDGNEYTAVFDGEIYSIDGNKDVYNLCMFSCAAEAVIELYAAYGCGCAEHIEGVFAFAVYDSRRSEIYLARDEFGSKPLYYTENRDNGGEFVFASEIKGLLKYGKESFEIDKQALIQAIVNPFDVSVTDVYKGIRELEKGCFAVYSRLGIQITHYKTDFAKNKKSEDKICVYRPFAEREFDTKNLLCEILNDFDYPVFDEYMAGLVGFLNSKEGKARTLAVEERMLNTNPEYAYRRADRIGMSKGIVLRIVPPQNEIRLKKSYIKKTEKKLFCIAEKLFCEDGENLQNLNFCKELYEKICKEKNSLQRIRMFARLIQSEYFLLNYPVIF